MATSLTDLNIAATYQQLLHTPDGSTIFDGTGSLVRVILASATGSMSVATASYAYTASYALNAGGVSTFPYTGSAEITGSLFLIGQGSFTSLPSYTTSDFFLVRNATTTLKVIDGIQITSSAQIPLQILDTNNLNLLQISQSGRVIFATSSITLTDAAPNGGVYFTSSSFYVGLD